MPRVLRTEVLRRTWAMVRKVQSRFRPRACSLLLLGLENSNDRVVEQDGWSHPMAAVSCGR